MIEFSNPPADPGRYSRKGSFWHFPDVPITFRAHSEHAAGARGRIVLLQGTGQEIIATGEWSMGRRDQDEYELTLTEIPDPLKPLVLHVESDIAEWCMNQPVYIGEAPDEATPRWIATCPQKMRYSRLNTQGTGYLWYPGTMPEWSSTPYPVRPGGRWDYSARTADFYQQRMTAMTTTGDLFPEFIKQPSGHIQAHFGRCQYHLSDAAVSFGGLGTYLFRDGPRNIGSIGYPAGGFVDDDGALIVASAPGRIARIDVTGHVTTIAGWRLSGLAADENFEFVGGIEAAWDHIWDVQRGPDGYLYVANTHGNRVDRIEGGKIVPFVGGAPTGYIDGIGLEARFNQVRGLAFRDGFMYVSDAKNHAIRRVDMRTREVTTVVRSADLHLHLLAHSDGLDGARAWARDGAFGEARFMHPQHIRFTSDGCLITPMHHQRQLIEFNLDTQQVRTLVHDLPGSSWRDMSSTWFTMHIDDGTTGPVDTLYYCGWEHSTDRMYDREGNPMQVFDGYCAPFPRARRRTGWDGPAQFAERNGYPQTAIPGRGAVWWGGVAGSGLVRLTPIGDTANTRDFDRYNRGLKLWYRSPHPNRPSPSLLYGPWGCNGYGLESIDDLGTLPDDVIASLLTREVGEYTTAELSDVIYFIRAEAITTPEEPTEPDPKEEPDVPELQVSRVVDVQDSWGDEFDVNSGDGRYSRKLSGVQVTDPGLVLGFVAVRKHADSVVDESEPGVYAPLRYKDTPMDLIVADAQLGGFASRGVHCYGLQQVENRTDAVRWSLGRIDGTKDDTSGRCAGIACVVPGGFVRYAITKLAGDAESISATIPTEPGDFILSFLSSGKNDFTYWPISNGIVVGQNHMNEQKPVRGQLAVHNDGNVEWTSVDGTQNFALVVLVISGDAAEPKEPPIEEPEHPAKILLDDAKIMLIDAQIELQDETEATARAHVDAAIASIDLAVSELP